MSIINRKLSKNGFSLIELMIAVTILALAVFGIFHAYSVGFLGIADARDRTVATNYAREAMEDVKNMDFEEMATATKSVISSNTKYRVDVNVSLESTNLKKVYTVVSWKDRNGVGKTVETSMLVNYTEIYATAATKIVLYADSYSILNETDDLDGEGTFTKLTAVIKDIKGNTVIDWDGDDVSFLIKSGPEFGNLSGITSTINGIAEETFTSSGYLLEGDTGYTVIEASVNLPIIGNVSDSVTIKITDGPVKIILSEPIPDIIKASTSNYSTITVSLCNAASQILNKSDLVTDVEITFSVFGEGNFEGNLDTSTITINTADPGLASEEITLYSTGNPGLASVLATADGLESDTVDVRFLGPPVSISISADPNQIYVDDTEGSTVTVSLLDVNGFSTNPEEILIISLTLETSAGVGGGLEHYSFSFLPSESEGVINTTTYSGQQSTGTATIIVSDGGSMENSVTINISSALVPDYIELTASPKIVQAAGGTSIITATVYDQNGKIVTNYTGTIIFHIVTDTSSDDISIPTTNGEAFTELSFSEPVIATITASSSDGLLNSLESVVVGFYGGADHITLTANPEYVKAGEGDISTITATVCDSKGITVIHYTGIMNFANTGIGTFIGDNPATITNGIATIELYSEEIGFATITASSTGLTTGNIEVEFYEETTLTLVDNSVIYNSTDETVTFNVKVTGDFIEVDEMKIIWSESGPQERFSKIVIDGVEVYTGGSDKSGTIVDIIDDVDLSIEEHTIELTFIQDMAGRQIDVMFYPPGEGWYLIRFDVPVSS